MMRTIIFSFVTLDIFYEDGSNEIKTFSPQELAGFKRSKKYKTILSKKTICSWQTRLKLQDSFIVATKKKGGSK